MITQTFYCDYQEWNVKQSEVVRVNQTVIAYRFKTKDQADLFAQAIGKEVFKEKDKEEWVVFNKNIGESWRCSGTERVDNE